MVTLVNRAKMGTATTGTGTITLGSAETGYQSFADAGVTDGQVVRYVIEDGSDWEIGSGTYTATGTTLSRTPTESSNAGAAINLSGSAVVYVSATAEDIPPVLELYSERYDGTSAKPTARGQNSIALGVSADTGGSNATAVGYNTTAGTTAATAVGFDAFADSLGSNAFGYDSYARSGLYATAIARSYASGADSFAAAIANNTSSYGATGANSVAIGYQARATAQYAIALSYQTQATGLASFASGYGADATGAYSISIGDSTLASGGNSVAIGRACSATADMSFASGYSAVASIYGKYARASHDFGPDGSAQYGHFVLRSDTTNATPEALTTNNSTAGTTNQIILPNNSAYAFHGTIVARQQASAGTACAAWKIEGLIRREGSAGTTVLVNSATTVLDNTPGWGMALSADTTNGGLKIEVTGAAATNIRWVCTCHTSEVTY